MAIINEYFNTPICVISQKLMHWTWKEARALFNFVRVFVVLAFVV